MTGSAGGLAESSRGLPGSSGGPPQSGRESGGLLPSIMEATLPALIRASDRLRKSASPAVGHDCDADADEQRG
ncbi:MAG: hypothetical protein ABI703_05370, partial [Gemmatimonadales bacterium]